MIEKIINTKNIENADVVLVSAPYEKTASSHKGTVNGPKKVIECLNTQIEFWNKKFKVEVTDFVKVSHINLKTLEKLSPSSAYKKIKQTCEDLTNKNKFVFLLGGEHSVSVGNLEALGKQYVPNKTTILHIDAHCDLRNDDSDYNANNPSKFAHSTVMRRASEMGYNIVQVGIRSYSKDEYEYFSNPKNKIKVFEWDIYKKYKIEDIIKSIKTKNVYISIDVDGFDPSVMPGTGTPVPYGLKWKYGIKLIEKTIEKFNLIGADIVEVSPTKDSVITEYSAAEIIYLIIANKFRDKLISK